MYNDFALNEPTFSYKYCYFMGFLYIFGKAILKLCILFLNGSSVSTMQIANKKKPQNYTELELFSNQWWRKCCWPPIWLKCFWSPQFQTVRLAGIKSSSRSCTVSFMPPIFKILYTEDTIVRKKKEKRNCCTDNVMTTMNTFAAGNGHLSEILQCFPTHIMCTEQHLRQQCSEYQWRGRRATYLFLCRLPYTLKMLIIDDPKRCAT